MDPTIHLVDPTILLLDPTIHLVDLAIHLVDLSIHLADATILAASWGAGPGAGPAIHLVDLSGPHYPLSGPHYSLSGPHYPLSGPHYPLSEPHYRAAATTTQQSPNPSATILSLTSVFLESRRWTAGPLERGTAYHNTPYHRTRLPTRRGNGVGRARTAVARARVVRDGRGAVHLRLAREQRRLLQLRRLAHRVALPPAGL